MVKSTNLRGKNHQFHQGSMQVLTVDSAGQIRRELQPLEALVLARGDPGEWKRMGGEMSFLLW